MFIHMWMHWFWITIASSKCLLLFTIQMISVSCYPHPLATEAGLLQNTSVLQENFNLYKLNESSHVGSDENITVSVDVTKNDSLELTSEETFTASSALETTSGGSNNDSSSGEFVGVADSSDLRDTYGDGSIDVFEYPSTKEHSKPAKVKIMANDSVESIEGGEMRTEEPRNVETLNIAEEKVTVNISVGEGVHSSLAYDVSSEALEPETAATPLTSEKMATTTNASVPAEEWPMKDEAVENSTVVPTLAVNASDLSAPAEDDRDAEEPKNETLVIENKVEESVIHTTVEPFPLRNRVAAATSAQNFEVDVGLNAGSVTGITLGILVVLGLFGAVSFVLYRRRYLNNPQVLHEKCSNLDSSGYIDEASLKENSEEMYSLDNDSFLNSLEAMTIQNYWTENVKHTKL